MIAFVAISGIWVLGSLEKQKPEAQLALLAIVFVVYYSAIRVPPTIYNLAWLIPLVIYHAYKSGVESRWRALGTANTLLISILCVTSFFASVYATNAKLENIADGRRANELLKEIQNLPETTVFATDKNRQGLSLQAVLSSAANEKKFEFLDWSSSDAATHRIEFQAVFQNEYPNIKSDECVVASNYHEDKYKSLGRGWRYSPDDWAFALIELTACN